MNVQAVIFDIYGTLLEVRPPPDDAPARWIALWQDRLKTAPRLTLAEFGAECDRIIAREHAEARSRGIPFPEVCWPAVVLEAAPEIASLPEKERFDFQFEQAGLWHEVRLMAGAAPVLEGLADAGRPAGLASNSQPYTLQELDRGLSGAGLSRQAFAPDLCFLSFEHGFSKPDPHVFRLLAARLEMRGVEPGRTLMVGDRWDHDIEPALAQGWQAWHLTDRPAGSPAGSWADLSRFLFS
ncbi:MAG: HAD family hydrolase [Verrucomicrobia bacterium]|nr:HAD family hydrolase [Verrucomicrobiota bacterium]